MSKTRMGKRVASLLLSLVMMLSLLPTTVYAEGADTGATYGAVQQTEPGDNTENTGKLESTGEGEDDSEAGNEGETSVTYVAQVGDVQYKTLEEAIGVAADGATVSLLDNVTLNTTLTVEGKTITIDVGGFTLTVATSGNGIVVENATLTLTGDNGAYVFDCTASGGDGIFVNNTDANTTSNLNLSGNVKIRVSNNSNSVIHAYAATGNASVNISGGALTVDGTGSKFSAVVIDQNAALNMNGGEIDLSVDFESYSKSYNDVVGVLLWGQNGKQENCTANINGGAIKVGGKNAFAQAVQVGMKNGYSENCAVNISGGEVVLNQTGSGEGYVYAPYNDAYATATITGGAVSGNVTALTVTNLGEDTATLTIFGGTFSGITVDEKYLAEGKTLDESGNVVDKAPEVKPVTVNGVGYDTLEAAIAAANTGDTVTLLADTTEDVTISKNITLDLGGKTLTNTNAGKATVTIAKGATATVKNGSVMGGTSFYTIQNNGTATLEDVTATAGNTGSSMIDNWGTLTINSGTYTGGLDTVKNEPNAKLTITGGEFTLTKGTSKGFTGVVFNYGDLTITGGTFIQSEKISKYGYEQVIYTDKDKNSSAVPSTVITGGTFKNLCTKSTAWTAREMNAAAGATKISGGTFNKKVTESYWAEGYGVYQTASGEYTAMPADKVARLGLYNYYTTLEEAIAAVGTGVSTSAVVYLLKNVTIDTQLVIDNSKAITLDLNGFTLTSTYAMGEATGEGRYALVNKTALTVKNGTFAADQARAIGAYAKLTLAKATVTQTLTGGHACVAFCANDTAYTITNSEINGAYAVANFANNATITIEDSKLKGGGCGLYHNGSNYGLKLTVTDTTINGSLDGAIGNENDPSGVYISGSTATVEKDGMQSASFTNCTIKGATAIEVKYTDLTLTDCTVEATAKTPSYSKNNNGMTALGFAVVSTDNSKDGVTPVPAGTVTITGKGNYTGLVGLGALEGVKETYTGFADGTIKVSGGTFDSAVMPEYCADGFVPTQNDNGTYGVREANYVAQVGSTKYESLAEAIKAAGRNATVKLLADTRENVTISTPYLTLDLNGFTLNGSTGERKPALTVTARVTVKDSSENQTGTIMREDTAENSGVSSHYVIDVQGDGWLTFESGNVKNNSGIVGVTGASLVRVGDDSVAKYPGLNIKGGTFTQDNFIVIKVDRGDLFLNGGTLNSAHSYAIEDWHRATIKGGTVNGTVAAWTYSGGLNSDLTISGGTINGDVTSVNYGNAEDKVAKVSITGGAVTGTLGTYIYSGGLTETEDTSKATIEVTGGTFAKDPTKYVVEDSAVNQNADGTFGVAKAYLAKVGETSYYTMDEARKAQSTSGEDIVLLRNYTTGSPFRSGISARVVDLNGYTWTCTGKDANSAAFEISNSSASLTVKNGKIVSSQLVGLIPSAMGGSIKYDNSSLMFDGVEMSTTATSGIETNGNNTNDTVTLKNSTLNVPNGFGIYFPSSGTLTIDKSTINAKTMGVQVCAGSLNITGEKTAIDVTDGPVEKTENDGAIQDGAAISIVKRAGYEDLGKIEVTGGTFTAKTGNAAIKAYDWANKTEADFTANDNVAVSSGTFSSAVPEGLCANGYISVANDDGTHTVKKGTYVAEYDGTKYETLQKAIDAASQKNGGQTEVKLLCDLTITKTVVFAKEFADGSVLLNLGGYTLTGNDCRALQINKGNLYLENGTVTSIGDNIVNSSSVIRIGSNEAEYSGISPMLYMRNGAKVLAPKTYGVTIFGSATRGEKLKVMSNAEIIATGPSPAISGNGGANYNTDDRTSGWKAEEIIIGENAVISAANNYAIYHPECGTLNIQGGTITGTGGIQMCSGTLKISNSPKITANGSADYDYTGDAGVVYDAAAISVINRGYPQGPATVTIKGTPTVTAANGEVIHAFTWSNSNKTDGEWAEAGDYINVSGGTYNKAFDEAYLAADCTLVTNSEGGYTVEQKKVAEYNGTQYTSLSQAILDANNSGAKATVKLLEDVTLTNSLGIGGTAAVTLNLNKKTLTLNGAQIYTQGSGTVTINNGTIKRTDVPTSGNANNFAIQVMSGSTLLLGGSTVMTKLTLTGKYGIYNVGGLLNVQHADINTDGWSIAVSDSASKTGSVIIGSVGTAKIVSQNGNCIGTAVNSKPNVTISKGTLASNGTTWDAGVVYWASEGTLTITGGTFTASSAEGSEAAAVYQKNGTVKISGTTAKLLGSTALVVQAGEGSTGTMVTELSGGTYSTKPEESWVVEGKEIHETTDGLHKVEGPYVVEVTFEDGTVTKYDRWFSAFTKGTAQYKNATVKLLKDIETTTLVSTYAKVTIDFNGHTLAVSSSNENDVAAITLRTGNPGTANVTLKDSVGNGGLKTTGTIYGVTVAGTGATLTVESGNYNCETTAVQVEEGTAYIKGGTFQTEAADKSHLLNCIDPAFKDGTAKMEVTGGTFVGFDPSANPEGENTTYVKTGYVSTNNGDGTFTVEEAKYVIKVTSCIEGTDQTVATPTGGGMYCEGEKVTVATNAVAGFKFLGWYDGATLLDMHMTYEHTVTGDCTLIAKYTAVSGGTFRLEVNASKFTVDEKTKMRYVDMRINAATEVVVEYTGNDKFLYWINGSNNVVSTEAKITLVAVGNFKLTAVVESTELGSDYAYVIFKNAFVKGQSLSADYYTSSDTIVFPSTPAYVGRTFKYWGTEVNGEIVEATQAVISGLIKGGAKTVIIAPVYESNGTYTVTVNYVDAEGNPLKDALTISGIGTGLMEYVTADEKIGELIFSHWEIGGKNVGTNKTYAALSRTDGDVVDLTAVYVTEGTVTTPENVLTIAATGATIEGGKYKLTFTANYSVDENATIKKGGFLFSNKDVAEEIFTIDNTSLVGLDWDGDIEQSGARNGVIPTSVETTRIYARAYITLADGTVIYSDIVNATYSEIVKK